MNIDITHVSVRLDFAFTYNIPQGCAYAHLRIPYLTEQAPHVSWKSHHNKVFTIHLMDLNHSPNHPGWLYPLLPGRDSSLLKYSAHDPTIGSICQPANPSRYSTSQSFPLVYTQHNFCCLWQVSGIPVFTRQFQNKVES